MGWKPMPLGYFRALNRRFPFAICSKLEDSVAQVFLKPTTEATLYFPTASHAIPPISPLQARRARSASAAVSEGVGGIGGDGGWELWGIVYESGDGGGGEEVAEAMFAALALWCAQSI